MEAAKGSGRIAGTDPAHAPLGRIMITEHAKQVVTDADVLAALERHLETHREKFVTNRPKEGGPPEDVQLLSSHRTREGKKFWVLTHSVHRITTLLLPSEY
jgi:hypothetical protein